MVFSTIKLANVLLRGWFGVTNYFINNNFDTGEFFDQLNHELFFHALERHIFVLHPTLVTSTCLELGNNLLDFRT